MPPIYKSTRAFNRLPRVAAAMSDRISKVNRIAATNIQQRAVQSFGGVRYGHRYRLSGYRSTIVHVASVPGEPPATMYGNLSNSVFTDSPDPFESFVYTTDEKAPYLEFGTINMAARPWLNPAATAEEEGYKRAMESAIKGAVRA